MKPALIAFSGIDGAGKSTQLALLEARYRREGIVPICLWSRGGYTPGFSKLKQLARRLTGTRLLPAGRDQKRSRYLRRKWIQRLWLALSICDLILVYGVWVRFWRLVGRPVLCDRYVWDTRIDFQVAFPERHVETWLLWKLLLFVTPQPDAGFLLVIPPDESERRCRLKVEPFPDPPAVRQQRFLAYMTASRATEWQVIDGTSPQHTIEREIVSRLQRASVLLSQDRGRQHRRRGERLRRSSGVPARSGVPIEPAVFILPPKRRSVAKALAAIGAHHVQWLYLGDRISTAARMELFIRGRAGRVPVAARLQKMALMLREAYLDYVGRVGSERSSPAWQLHPFAERNPCLSNVLRFVCYIKLCEEVMAANGGPRLLIIVEDPDLRRALFDHMTAKDRRVRCQLGAGILPVALRDWLSAFVHHAHHVLLTSYQLAVTRLLSVRPLEGSDRVCEASLRGSTTLLYTWLDERSLQSGPSYHDSYFGDLGARLSSEGDQVVYVANVVPGVRFGRALTNIRCQAARFLMPTRYLCFRDALAAAWQSFASRPKPTAYPLFESIDISRFIHGDAVRSWREGWPYYLFLRGCLVRAWKTAGLRIKAVIYPFENLRWEKMFCLALRQCFPKATLIGYQHASFSSMLLNYFCSTEEAKVAPLPDRIVVNGVRYHELLGCLAGGGTRIVTGGAIRYEYLFAGGRRQVRHHVEKTRPGGRVMVAGSFSLETSAELIWNVLVAFQEARDYEVVIKCHPLMPYEAVARAVGLGTLPDHCRVERRPVPALLEASDVLLYSDSTAALEALMMGVPVVQVSSDMRIDLDPLDVAPSLRRVAYSPSEIMSCVRACLETDPRRRALEQELWRRVVSEMLMPVTDASYARFRVA